MNGLERIPEDEEEKEEENQDFTERSLIKRSLMNETTQTQDAVSKLLKGRSINTPRISTESQGL